MTLFYADSPYGVTVGLNPGSGAAAPYPYWTQLFADINALGLTWLRFQLSWKNIQLTQTDPPSAWSWAALDDAVAQCNAHHINLCYTLRGAPTWALQNPLQQATTVPFYLPDPTMYAYFASQVALRYNGLTINPNTGLPYGTLQSVECGNEDFHIQHTPPNLGWLGLHASPYPEYNGTGGVTTGIEPARDPYFFANVLPAAASAIRANAAPGCLIGAAALWWRSHPALGDFITGLYTQLTTAAALIDYLNLHFYSNAADPMLAGTGTTYLPSFLQAITDINTAAVTAGDTTKKIWISEIGWGTNTNNGSTVDCDPQTQAYRYCGTAAPGPYSTSGAPGNPPYYTQNTDYTYETARKSGKVAKIFPYTLSYKTGTTTGNQCDTSSIVQFSTDGLATRTNLPAYTAIQTYIASNPQWSIIPSPSTLSFSAPGTQSVTLRNGGASGTWTATVTTTSGGAWLTTSATSGTLATDATQIVTVTVTSLALTLAPGTYTGTITYTLSGLVTTLTVTLTITSPGVDSLSVSTSTLTFTGIAGTSDPAAQSLTLTNTGQSSGSWSASSNVAWATPLNNQGTLNNGATQTVSIAVSNIAAFLRAGTYTGIITYTRGTATASVTLTLTVNPPAVPGTGVQVVTLTRTNKLTLYQNDTIPLISVAMTDDTGTVLPLTGLSATAITMKLIRNTVGAAFMTPAPIICTGVWSITNAAGGIARYQWVPTDTLTPGEYLTDIIIQTASGPIHLDPFIIEILPS